MPIFSATLVGVQPLPVEIEIDLSDGLPFFQIVGLPDQVLKESKTRVKSAICQAGYDFPYDRRVVLNLSPSKIRKEGSGFELALAARILVSSGQMALPKERVMFLGELALDGHVRVVSEIGALAYVADQTGPDRMDGLVVPRECAREIAAHVRCPVLGLNHISELKKEDWWKTAWTMKSRQVPDAEESVVDLKSSFSHFWAEHLVLAVVGRHHYLLCGPPGCGKTYFAESLRFFTSRHADGKDGIQDRVLDALFHRKRREIPWAAPHHSVSVAGLLGGGNTPRPGAITQAHGGVLFLDELLEFSPAVLDSLREPLEKGHVEIFRAGHSVQFPGRIQIIAATNPCRCGFWGSQHKACRCSPAFRQAYLRRMSGPFFDRFDAKVFCIPSLDPQRTVSGNQIADRIREALQFKRKIGSPRWLPESLDFLNREQGRKISNFRSLVKVKALAETMALVNLSGEVTHEDLEKACRLQILNGLESLC